MNPLAARLPKHVTDKAEVVFRQYGGAFSEQYSGRKRRGQPLTTILYMTFTPQIWTHGPALLTAFGMGGPETLIWAHLLRCRYPHLVCSRSFVMAEVTEQLIAPDENDLNFADRWNVNIIAEIPLEKEEKSRRTSLTKK